MEDAEDKLKVGGERLEVGEEGLEAGQFVFETLLPR